MDDEYDRDWCIERHNEIGRRLQLAEHSVITLENKLDQFVKESSARQEDRLARIHDKIDKSSYEREQFLIMIQDKFDKISNLMQTRLPAWATIVIAILSSLVTGFGVSAFFK
jgi:hypothetical protein